MRRQSSVLNGLITTSWEHAPNPQRLHPRDNSFSAYKNLTPPPPLPLLVVEFLATQLQLTFPDDLAHLYRNVQVLAQYILVGHEAIQQLSILVEPALLAERKGD